MSLFQNALCRSLALISLLPLFTVYQSVSAATPSIKEENLIAGVKGNKLTLLVDLYPYRDALKALSPKELEAFAVATATTLLPTYWANKRFAKFPNAKVEYILLSEFDEYRRPNLAKSVSQGYLLAKKENNGVKVTETHLRFKLP